MYSVKKGRALEKSLKLANKSDIENLLFKEAQLVKSINEPGDVALLDRKFKNVKLTTKIGETKISKHIKEIIYAKGYGDVDIARVLEINRLVSKQTISKNKLQYVRKFVEDYFPLPKKGEKMVKVISLENLKRYHIGENINVIDKEKVVGEFVVKKTDINFGSSQKLIDDLRLDVPGSTFSKNEGYAVIEFENNFDITRPYLSEKTLNHKPPYTKTGLTGVENKLIPEYYMEGLKKIPKGAVLRVYDMFGK
ncbi:MAG: hypothetical protein N4A49_06210 [Marinifilaceae bacterium]|nr:hypothetical protein [Marinifilaceae bacterium]